jgi:hypothetical protein
MSVFICGSERDFVSNNDDVHKWELPAQVRECLDKLMSDGEDCTGHHVGPDKQGRVERRKTCNVETCRYTGMVETIM